MNDRPIGVFDSGIGGLTVLKEIFKALPAENTIYLGDTARVPYGARSPETVIRYSFENTRFLVSKGIKLLVIACNTASSVSLDEIRKSFDMPVIGVIEPGAKAAVRTTKTNRIGIIGTEGTIKSNSYINAINSIRKSKTKTLKEHGTKYYDRYFEIVTDEMVIFTKACPLFVPLAEEGWTSNDVAYLTAEHYLGGFKKETIDTLVLGCTHYPLLKSVISKVMGENVTLIDSAIETAGETKEILRKQNMEKKSKDRPIREFYVTDAPGRFVNIGEKFLEQKIENIQKINLGG